MKISPFLRHLLAAFFVLALAVGAYTYRNVILWALGYLHWPQQSLVQRGVLAQDLEASDVSIVASGLEAPWAIAFLPDGGLLVTERPGRLRHIAPDGALTSITVEGATKEEEAGLAGVAVHPDFVANGWIYLYVSYRDPDGALKNRVDRYRFESDELFDRSTIVQNIPASDHRNGGALAFGPDRKLYVTTGDAGDETTAQDLRSLGGKILRLNDDGSIPSDNPFGTPVWSYGHRNPQGLAWDREGRLWATEHGRSGLAFGYDELNLIQPSKNYGWPIVQGNERADGMRAPIIQSGPHEAWDPAGAAHLDGKIFFGGLRGEALYQVNVDADPVVIKAHFESEYGRIRAVAVGPDHLIYFTTSNRDGGGVPKEGDDRLIRVNPRLFR